MSWPLASIHMVEGTTSRELPSDLQSTHGTCTHTHTHVHTKYVSIIFEKVEQKWQPGLMMDDYNASAGSGSWGRKTQHSRPA